MFSISLTQRGYICNFWCRWRVEDKSNFLAGFAEVFISGQTRSGKGEEGRGAAVRENNYAIPAFAYHLYFREHCESRGPL